jgi:HAD superfamily hydrolase (TIGR01509 family)
VANEPVVKAVIFDMDGVIIDTEGAVQTCCQQAAGDMGFDLDEEFYFSELVGRGWADCDVALVTRFGTGFLFSEFKRRFEQRWSTHLRLNGIAVKPGLHEVLAFLASRRIPMAVATSTDDADAKISLQAAGIADNFSVFVTGDQVSRGKPDPEIYLTAATRLGVDARSCVALEDSTAGVLSASRAGMTTLLIPDGDRIPNADALGAAYAVVASLHDAKDVLSKLVDAQRRKPGRSEWRH